MTHGGVPERYLSQLHASHLASMCSTALLLCTAEVSVWVHGCFDSTNLLPHHRAHPTGMCKYNTYVQCMCMNKVHMRCLWYCVIAAELSKGFTALSIREKSLSDFILASLPSSVLPAWLLFLHLQFHHDLQTCTSPSATGWTKFGGHDSRWWKLGLWLWVEEQTTVLSWGVNRCQTQRQRITFPQVRLCWGINGDDMDVLIRCSWVEWCCLLACQHVNIYFMINGLLLM